MLILDDHIHPWVKEARYTPDLATAMSQFLRPEPARRHADAAQSRSIDDLLRDMDKAGIERGIIVGMDLSGSLGVVMPTNDSVAELVARYPGRLIGFSSVDPTNGDAAVAELERAIRQLGLKGLKLVPPVQKFSPADEKFNPLWEKVVELDIPVWIHTGHQLSTEGSEAKYGHPSLIDTLAGRFPEMKIIMGHLSFPWFWEAWSICCRRKNVYVDTSGYGCLFNHFPWDAFTKFDIEHKILFGTDYPLLTFDEAVRDVQNLPIEEQFKAKILYQNAAALLGIEV